MSTPQIDWTSLFTGLLEWECGEDVLCRAHDALETALAAAGPKEPSEAWPGIVTLAQLQTALNWLAPQVLTDCGWLRAANSMGHGHEPSHARLFAVWLDAAGLAERSALSASYRAFAQSAGVELSRLTAGGWRERDPPSPAFCPAAVHLALERAAPGRYPELLGYSLAHWRVSRARLFWLENLAHEFGLPPFYIQRHRALLGKHRAPLFELAGDLPRDTRDYRRLLAGWRLREWTERHFRRDLRRALFAPPSLAARAAALLDRLRPFATGHHGKILLEGKTFDDWLSAGDWHALHRALRTSGYFAPNQPDASPLFRAMAFGGPMFGVFSTDEERLLREWLGSEGPEAPAGSAPQTSPPPQIDSPGFSACATSPPVIPAWTAGIHGQGCCQPSASSMAVDATNFCRHDGGTDVTFPSLRALFHALVNENNSLPVLDAAERHVRRILRWTAPLAWTYRGTLGFAPYSSPMLRQRIFAAYRREVARYRPPAQRQAVPAKLCRWGIEQLAPAILVDGSWLRRLGRLEPAENGTIRRLTRIFSDETGAGQAEHHHGNVYRQLLEDQGIHLPPLASREFASHPRLESASFVLPTYLLAIGSFPESYFPELLGLNLAIEFSGLGAGYMHAVDDMQRHGMNPLIVRLHLSIDNLADGHAALALEAIENFLEEARLTGGADAVANQWRRIQKGFLSLRVATIPFLLAGMRAWLHCR
jgi:hypothetical protein